MDLENLTRDEIEELSEDEIFDGIKRLEKEGFYFFVDCHPDKEIPFYTPDRVKLPDGRILDEDELNKEIKKYPNNQLLRKASLLLDLCLTEQYFDERGGHFSFNGDEDMENCREKYGGNL